MTKFKKGKSGNPKGRPKGIADKRVTFRNLLEPHAKKLTSKVIEKALGGDMTAMRLCLERLIPPIRARDEAIKIKIGGTLAEKGKSIMAAIADGTVNPDTGASLMQTLTGLTRILEADDLDKRITALEKKNAC